MKWISCDYSGQESRIIADITNDKALLDLFNHGCGDVHSLVAYMSYPHIIPRETKVEDIKGLFHDQRQDAKGIEFSINYGGDANTIANNKGIPILEAQKIYDSYMKGFIGMKTYQDYQRKFVMSHGYIVLNQFSQHKAYIYDYDILMGIKERFTSEFWATYRQYKGTSNPKIPKAVLQKVYKRFADGEDFNAITGVYDYTVILTYVSLMVSIGGMMLSVNGQIKYAVVCLAISGLCDMFDGKIARTKKNETA